MDRGFPQLSEPKTQQYKIVHYLTSTYLSTSVVVQWLRTLEGEEHFPSLVRGSLVIFSEGELSENSVIKNFLTTASDGKNYQIRYYNFDIIVSVGYRVKSHRGTQFRIWATLRLREYIVKGFTMDYERLKQPPRIGKPGDQFVAWDSIPPSYCQEEGSILI
jgi:hypothetical protein